MIIILFIILITIGLALWFWLASRISQVSNTGALLGMFLIVPAFYWTYKLWNNPRANLKTPAIANLIVNLIGLPSLFLFSTHYATSQIAEASIAKDNPQMTHWCQEQNDAVYDPVLKLCVEPTKADVQAQEQRDNLMGQLEQHLHRHGVAGELDRSVTPEITALKNLPDVVDAASYQFSQSGTAQHPPLMLLCLSEVACNHMANKQKKDGSPNIAVGKGKLMLWFAPDAVDNMLLKKIKAAVATFKPT